MNRRDLLFYLENLRNLEVIRNGYKRRKNDAEKEINNYQNSITLLEKDHFNAWFYISLFGFIGTAALEIILIKARQRHRTSLELVEAGLDIVRFIIIGAVGLMALILLIVFLYILFSTVSDKKYVAKKNSQIRKDTPMILGKIDELKNAVDAYNAEISKAEKLLLEAYSLNIVPLEYRDLVHILYIWNYMSSSAATLEDALLHSHIESGIQLISGKLDVIIEQNMQIIMSQSYLSSKVSETHERLSAIESNTYTAAVYSRIGAYYASLK